MRRVREPIWKCVEREVAQELNGKLVPGSGSGYRKGDVQLRLADGTRVLVEVKSTTSERYQLSRSLLDKVSHQADAIGAIPIIVIVLCAHSDADRLKAYLIQNGRNGVGEDWRSRRLDRRTILEMIRSGEPIHANMSWVFRDPDQVREMIHANHAG